MMKVTRALRLSTLLVAAIVLAAPRPVLAWGSTGHQAVAAMASRLLTPPAKQMVEGIFRLRPVDMAMRRIALWADSNSRPETVRWHTVAIPPNGGAYDRARDCPQDACIVEKITEFSRLIIDTSATADARSDALAYLIHFVADVHMPMHGFAPPSPQGGVWVKIGDNVQKLQLWWDDEFIGQIGDEALSVADILTPQISPDQQQAWSAGGSADWANESFTIAREFISKHGLLSGNASENSQAAPLVLPDSVLADVKAIVSQRLRMAAVRLAWLINSAK